MKTLILLISLSIFPFPTIEAQECACCSADFRGFDFWIGDWEVYNPEGKKIGENKVIALEDHCIIAENWTGASGGSGKSFNYFDKNDHTWNQLWISNTGNILKLKGTASESKMVLQSEHKPGEVHNKITWTLNDDGSVTQLWEVLDANGKVTQKAFEGIYRKNITEK